MYVRGVENKRMEGIIVLIFLVPASVWDLKKKGVPKKYLFIWGITAFVYLFLTSIIGKSTESLINAFWGVIPGLVGLFLAYVSREQIGFGDGWVLLLMGLLLGAYMVLSILFMALLVLTIVSIILLATRKAKRKTSIPFIPFLFFGHIIIWGLGSIL